MPRSKGTKRATAKVLAELEERGLLLQAGAEFPSIANIVAREQIVGSWWAHPRANVIYWVCQELDHHPDVTEARLIAGKVTHLWRSVWADVAAVALENAPWQWDGIEEEAARALVARAAQRPVRLDSLDWFGLGRLGDTCRMLEKRLLVKADEIHTESGAHTKVLSSWRAWWEEHATGPLPTPEEGRANLEARLGDAARWLPWRQRRRTGITAQLPALTPRAVRRAYRNSA